MMLNDQALDVVVVFMSEICVWQWTTGVIDAALMARTGFALIMLATCTFYTAKTKDAYSQKHNQFRIVSFEYWESEHSPNTYL